MDRLASSNAGVNTKSLKYLNDIDVPIENWKYEALYGKRFMTILPSKSKPATVEYHLFFQEGPNRTASELFASLSDKNSEFAIPVTTFQPLGNLMFVVKIDRGPYNRMECFELALPWIAICVILSAFLLTIFFIVFYSVSS